MAANYGEMSSGEVIRAIIATQDVIDTLPGTWLELPYGVGVGWTTADGGTTWLSPEGQSPPDEPSTTEPPSYLMDGYEWVARFTDDEWAWLKQQRNVTPATNASKKLDRLMDAIRWTNSVDVSSSNMDPFYQWLLDNGIPGGQTRIDELRAPR